MFENIQKLDDALGPLRNIADKYLYALLDFAIRLYMADIFFRSGWLKLNNYLNGDWGSTLFLFQEIHPVPFIPAELAAIGATAGELIFPVLLVFGLFGRIGAFGLLATTMVIEFGVPAEYGIQNAKHYVWMMLLAVPLLKGPGMISLDYVFRRLVLKKA